MAGGRILPLLLFLLVACGGPDTPSHPHRHVAGTHVPAPTRVAPTHPAQPRPPPLATPLAVIPVVVATQPAPAPTPFPDAQEIVYAVLGIEAGKHWASHQTSGSITAPGPREQVALVGNSATITRCAGW